MKELRKVNITKIHVGEITLIFGQVQGCPAWRWHGQNFGGGVELPEEFMLGFHSFHAAAIVSSSLGLVVEDFVAAGLVGFDWICCAKIGLDLVGFGWLPPLPPLATIVTFRGGWRTDAGALATALCESNRGGPRAP